MFKKQIGCFILTICMMASMVGALPAQAADLELLPPVEGQSNVIVNGDFEALDENGGFTDWYPYGGKWENNEKVMPDTVQTHGGNNVLKIKENISDKNPWIRQLVPVVGGAEYQFTGWVYAEGNSIPLVKFEGYNTNVVDGEFATTAEAIWFDKNQEMQFSTGKMEGGKWVQFSYIYKPHVNTRYIAFYLRISETGTVWFDDVSLYMTKGPSMFDVNLNSYNYYTSETEGTVNIDANTTVYTDTADWNVTCRILDGETVMWEKDVPLASGSAEIKFDLTPLTATDRDYVFEASLYEGNAEEASQTNTVTFGRRYVKPARVGEDGIYRDENGEIFHPVISYHLYKLENIDKYAHDMGINVIQMVYDYVADPEGALEYLDELHKRGLKALVTLYYQNIIASDPRVSDLVKEYIPAIKHHPAIWAYGIQDEPIGKNTAESLVTEAYELVRELDPDHPVYCIDQREWMYPQLVRNLDVLAIDNYPYGAADAMNYVYDSTKYAVDLAGLSGKPVYPILQFFARGTGAFTKNPGELYFPTASALRNMMYQVLMAGAKGFGFYSFDWYIGDKLVMDTETGDGLRLYNDLEKELMFEYFVEGKYPTFASNYNDNENARWASFVKDGEIYMVILNRKEFVETEITIPLISDNGLVKVGSFSAEAYTGGGEDTRGIQNLSVVLEPGAATVYKIKPSAGIDTKKLTMEVSAFSDIADYGWAKEQIEALHEKEIVNVPEEGKFLPGENITRGEFAYFLVRTLGLEGEETELFADVPEDSFYAKEIAAGKAAGVLKGIGENSYAPEAEISRQDMMTLIARGLELKGKTDLTGFSDADEIADYAKEGVEAMIAEGLIEGNADGTLNPLGNTTRAEAAVIMHRILEGK